MVKRERFELSPAGFAAAREDAQSVRDLYVSALMQPGGYAPAMLALAGFMGALAQLPAKVNEPLIGEIRLQWWRDALQRGAFALDGTTRDAPSTTPTSAAPTSPPSTTAARPAEGAGGTPLSDQINALRAAYTLPTTRFIAIIDAHTDLIYPEPPVSFAAMEEAATARYANLFALAYAVRQATSDPGGAGGGGGADDAMMPPALVEAGRAYGLLALWQALPALYAQGRAPLPPALLDAHGIGEADLAAATRTQAMARLSEDFAQPIAQAYRAAAPTLRQNNALRAAALPVALVPAMLRLVAAQTTNPLRQSVALSPLRRFWLLGRARVRLPGLGQGYR